MTEIPLCYFRGRDGARLAYRELGEGRPLILIHGYLSTAMVMVDGGIARKLARRGYRVILPDLRGHGDSARPHDAAAYPPGIPVARIVASHTAPGAVQETITVAPEADLSRPLAYVDVVQWEPTP